MVTITLLSVQVVYGDEVGASREEEDAAAETPAGGLWDRLSEGSGRNEDPSKFIRC